MSTETSGPARRGGSFRLRETRELEQRQHFFPSEAASGGSGSGGSGGAPSPRARGHVQRDRAANAPGQRHQRLRPAQPVPGAGPPG